MTAEAEVVRLKADNEQLRALLQDLSATRNTAVNMKLERDAEIERLKAQNDTIFTDAAGLTQAIDALAMANKELHAEVERLRTAEVYDLEAKQVLLAKTERLKAAKIELAEDNLRLRQIVDGYMRATPEQKP